MMEQQLVEQERSVVRWGGLAALLGGALFIFVFVWVGLVVGEVPADPVAAVERFPSIQVGRVVENGLYLLVLVLWAASYLGLYHALRRANLAAALFGSVTGVMAMTVLAVGALPHVPSSSISNFYHAPEATAEAQAALALMFKATWSVFDAMLYAGIFVAALGTMLLGLAMLGAETFGRGYGWLSIILGLIGLLAAAASMVDPDSAFAAGGVFSLIIFHLVLGWRAYRVGSG